MLSVGILRKDTEIRIIVSPPPPVNSYRSKTSWCSFVVAFGDDRTQRELDDNFDFGDVWMVFTTNNIKKKNNKLPYNTETKSIFLTHIITVNTYRVG